MLQHQVGAQLARVRAPDPAGQTTPPPSNVPFSEASVLIPQAQPSGHIVLPCSVHVPQHRQCLSYPRCCRLLGDLECIVMSIHPLSVLLPRMTTEVMRRLSRVPSAAWCRSSTASTAAGSSRRLRGRPTPTAPCGRRRCRATGRSGRRRRRRASVPAAAPPSALSTRRTSTGAGADRTCIPLLYVPRGHVR